MSRRSEWWRGRLLHRLDRWDELVFIFILFLGAATLFAGREAARSFRPRTAVAMSRFVDDLDAPTRLPNALLTDFSEKSALLYERIEHRYAVVAFYAPWCPPCQKELPHLIRDLGTDADILVVVSSDEDREHTKRQLANLDLGDRSALVDTTGELFREARVSALPTTFVINKFGGVRLRAKGYSSVDLYRMKSLVRGAREDFDP